MFIETHRSSRNELSTLDEQDKLKEFSIHSHIPDIFGTGNVSYWVENFIKFRHGHLFRAEDRFCNKIIKCPQEVEVLNRVKQIPCRKILSRTYGHENKRSPFVGRKREREREREREFRSCICFDQKVTFIQINERTYQSRNLISVIQNSLKFSLPLVFYTLVRNGRVCV